jgi:hypothetical protein
MKNKKVATTKNKALTTEQKTEKTQERKIVELITGGIYSSVLVLKNAYPDDSDVGAAEYIKVLKEQGEAVHNGDLKRLETMLSSQATALDSLFATLAFRSQSMMGKNQPDVMDKYMRLALKAQSQCRQTVETLAEIKNPRPYIQNNKAQYQQVNNGAAVVEKEKQHKYAHTHAHAGENQKPSNELLIEQGENLTKLDIITLENQNYETLDARRTSKTSRTDKELATMEA